jgi:hypothetical protein
MSHQSRTTVLTSYMPRHWILLSTPSGDQLWDPEELQTSYKRLYSAIMERVKNGGLHYCRNGISMYFVMTYNNTGLRTN